MNFSRMMLGGWFLTAVGGICLISSLVSWSHTRSYLHTAPRIEATVVRLFEGYNGTHYSTTVYFPIYYYDKGDGTRGEIYSGIGKHPAAYKRGDKVTLIYNADNPRDSMPYTFWNFWARPVKWLGSGILALLAGLWALRSARNE